MRCVHEYAHLLELKVDLVASVGLLTAVTAGAICQIDDANTVRERAMALVRRGWTPPAVNPDDLVSQGEREWLAKTARNDSTERAEKRDGNTETECSERDERA